MILCSPNFALLKCMKPRTVYALPIPLKSSQAEFKIRMSLNTNVINV